MEIREGWRKVRLEGELSQVEKGGSGMGIWGLGVDYQRCGGWGGWKEREQGGVGSIQLCLARVQSLGRSEIRS